MLFPEQIKRDTFNFFFIGSINYFFDTISVNSSFSEIRTSFIQYTVGYGFNYIIFNKLFLSSNLGLGFRTEFRDFNFDTNASNTVLGFAGIFSLGLTYKL